MRYIVKWLRNSKGHKYINGGKGVISILLAGIMLPFLGMADYLVETARYHDAVAVLDETMDSAGLSTLSYYDDYLLDRFGLLATSQDDISSTYKTYLNANLETYESWSLSDISVTGEYPLSDTDVLKQQIADVSKFSSPTALAGDFAISELIELLKYFKAVESLEKWTKVISTSGDSIDAMLTLSEDLQQFDSDAITLEQAEQNYGTKYDEFKQKIEDLKTALSEQAEKQQAVEDIQEEIDGLSEDADEEERESLEQELTDAQDALKTAEKAVETVTEEVKSAKEAYSTAIETLKSGFTDYQSSAEKVMKSLKSVSDNLEKYAEAKDSTTEKIDQEQEELETSVEEMKNKVAEATENGEDATSLKEEQSALESRLEDYKNTKSNMDKTQKAVESGSKVFADAVEEGMNSYDEDKVAAAGEILDGLKTNVDNFDVASITVDFTLDETQYYKTIEGVMGAAAIEAIISALEEQMKGETEGEFSLWTVCKSISTIYRSLLTTNGMYDSRLDGYLSENLTEYEPGEIDAILSDISDLLNCYDGAEGSGVKKILSCLKNLFTALWNLLSDIVAYAKGIVTRLVSAIQELASGDCGEKFLFDEYLVKNLPNRTSIDSNSSIKGKAAFTDYKFSKIKLKYPSEIDIYGTEIDTIISLLYDVKTGGTDKMFSAAELEYIITGSRSEIVNQSVAFFNLYILRMLVDFIPVMANSEIREIASGSAAVTAGFSIPAVYAAYIVVEPLLDAVFLVNGKEVPLIKTKAYLTPSGISAFVKNLSTLKLYNKSELQTLSQEAFGSGIPEDAGGSVGYLNWDYSKYMLLQMLVCGDSATYLERLSTLINLEASEYYGEFNIDNSYTYVKAKVKGKYSPVLPVGSLANGGNFVITRSRARGY